MIAVDPAVFGMLWMASYVFLLRVPSEGLPMARGGEGVTGQSVLSLVDPTTVELKLASRKNKPRGERLRRSCSCRGSGKHPMCPVHALWHDFFANLEPGAQPWVHLAPRDVISSIRDTLTRLQVPHPEHYATHAFRRGHAKDLQKSNQPLAKICAFGGWKVGSNSVLAYIDQCELDQVIPLNTCIQLCKNLVGFICRMLHWSWPFSLKMKNGSADT